MIYIDIKKIPKGLRDKWSKESEDFLEKVDGLAIKEIKVEIENGKAFWTSVKKELIKIFPNKELT